MVNAAYGYLTISPNYDEDPAPEPLTPEQELESDLRLEALPQRIGQAIKRAREA